MATKKGSKPGKTPVSAGNKPKPAPKKDPTPTVKTATPRIDKMLNQGLTKDQILDRLNGEKNLRDLSRAQLRAIGYNPTRIENILGRQTRGLTTGRIGTSGGGGSRVNTPNGRPPNNAGDDVLDEWDLLPDEEDFTEDWLSAYDLFSNILESWGIPMGGDIEAIIRQAAMDGIDPSMIELIIPDIQNTQTWRNRFPGWHKRVGNGYNQITVGEYLQLEDAYHRIMQENGLPPGFYDDAGDFGNWIANDVSPDEIRDRVQKAMNLTRQVDPTAKDLLRKFYGVGPGDIAAYFLDQNRALPALDRQYKAVNVAKYAAKAGLKIGQAKYYESLVEQGVSEDVAAQGYETVASFNRAFGQLAGIYGERYTQEDAEQDVFFNRNDKRRRLLAREIANFSGSSRGFIGRAQRDNY